MQMKKDTRKAMSKDDSKRIREANVRCLCQNFYFVYERPHAALRRDREIPRELSSATSKTRLRFAAFSR